MSAFVETANAKINLTLDVTGERPDGYHDLCMVMQSVTLCDTLQIMIREGTRLEVQTTNRYIPKNDKNLAAAAAVQYFRNAGIPRPGLSIFIEKNIPVCAGLGGGSSDGAAVLRVLNARYGALTSEQLLETGAQVGSDVPYCIAGGTMLAQGKGELLSALAPLPPCYVVICKPDFPISTPILFSKINCTKLRCRPDTGGMISALEEGDLSGVARRVYNVFEDVIEPKRREELKAIRTVMIDSGALGVSMSGTGPSMFGLFDRRESAEKAQKRLLKRYKESFLTRSV